MNANVSLPTFALMIKEIVSRKPSGSSIEHMKDRRRKLCKCINHKRLYFMQTKHIFYWKIGKLL